MTFQNKLSNRCFCAFLSAILTVNFALPVQAQSLFTSQNNTLNLPPPSSVLALSPGFEPPVLIGLKIDPQEPFKFDFIIDTGEEELSPETIEAESKKLIKYFLVGLTINEDDLWVNLSPYERDRMITEHFRATEMGQDMLAQDYILKQITASLIYPEDAIGKKFWDNVYQKAYEYYGTTDIPIDTFNKVWVMPKVADIYTDDNTALITGSELKVMLEDDYFAMQESKGELLPADHEPRANTEISKNIMNEVVIPEIEDQVNHGRHFANLRQIYNALILAFWFKQNLKQSIWEKIYIGKNKVKGVDANDPKVVDAIYEQYLEAFKKGAFNYIKEDYDPAREMVVERKYFSGGVVFGQQLADTIKPDSSMKASAKDRIDDLTKKGRIKKVSSAVVTADEDISESDPFASTIFIHRGAKIENGRISGGEIVNTDAFHKNMLSSWLNTNSNFTGVIENYRMNNMGGLSFGNKRFWEKRAGCEKKMAHIVMEKGKVIAIYHESGEELYPYYENFIYEGAEIINGEIQGGQLVNPEGMANRKQLNAYLKRNDHFTGIIDKVRLGKIGELVRFNDETFWQSRSGFANMLVRIIMKDGIVTKILDPDGNMIYPFERNFLLLGAKIENGQITGGELLNPIGAIDRQALNRLLNEHPGFTGVLKDVPLNINGGLTDFLGQNFWGKLADYSNALVNIVMESGELAAVFDKTGKQIFPFLENYIYAGAEIQDGQIIGGELVNTHGFGSRLALNKFLRENPNFSGVIDKVLLNTYGGLKDFNGKDYWTYLPGMENKPVRLVVQNGELIKAYSESGERFYPFEENYVYLNATITDGKIVGGTLINKGGSPGRNALSNLMEGYPDFTGVIDRLHLDSKGGLKFRNKGYWQHKKGYENALIRALVINDVIVEAYDMDGHQLYAASENNFIWEGAEFRDGKIIGGKLLNKAGLRDKQEVNTFLKKHPLFTGVIKKVPLTSVGGLGKFNGKEYWDTRSGYENALVTIIMKDGEVIKIWGPNGEDLYPYTEFFIYQNAYVNEGKILGGELLNPEGLLDRNSLINFLKQNPAFTGVVDRIKLNGIGGLGSINGKTYWMSMPGYHNAYIRLVFHDGIITEAFAEDGTQIYPFANNYVYTRIPNEDGTFSEELLTPSGLINRQTLNKWLANHPGFTGMIREIELTKNGGLTDLNKKDYWRVMPGYENKKVSVEMMNGEVIKVTDKNGLAIYPFTENFIYRGGKYQNGTITGGELLNPGGYKSRPMINAFLRENPNFSGIFTHIKLNAAGGLTDFNGKDYWTGRSGFENNYATLVMENGELINAYAEDSTELYPFHENFAYADATIENGRLTGGTLINAAGFADRQGLNQFLKNNPEFTGVLMRVKLHHSGGLMNLNNKDYWSMRPGFEDAYVNIVMKNGDVTHVYSEKGKMLYPFKENYIYDGATLENGELLGGELITAQGLFTRKSINDFLATRESFNGVIRKVRLSPKARVGQIKNVLYKDSIEGFENELSDLVISNDKLIAVYHHTTGQLLWTEDKSREAVKMLNDLWKKGDFEKLINLFGEDSTQRILFHFLGNITPQQIIQMSKKFKEELPRSKKTKSSRKTFTQFLEKLSKIDFFNLPASVEFENILTREIFFITYSYIIKDHKFIDVIKEEIARQKLNPMLRRIFASIIQKIENINAFEVTGLKETTKLKFYQKLGVQFVLEKRRALLGDRPGLGKTVQALAAAVNAYDGKGAQKVMIVCPKISMANVWRGQIERHLKGDQKTFVLKRRSDLQDPKKLKEMQDARFVIINYEIIRGENAAKLRQQLKDNDFDFIIADEAHRMRNDTQVSDAIMELDAPYKLLVTASAQKGRSIGKIFNLLHWLYPEKYPSRKQFLRQYGSEQGFRQLKTDLNDFTIRRYMSDVLYDMPKLDVEHRMVQMTGEQATLYRVIEQRFLEELNDPNNGVDSISYLGYLTKAAIDTSLIREIVMTDMTTGETQKLIPSVSRFEVAGKKYAFSVENGSSTAFLINKTNKGETPVPVEFKSDTEYIEIAGHAYQLQLRDRESHSAKFQVLDELVSDVVDKKKEKIAIFTGYVKAVTDLKKRYEAKGFKVLTITGVFSPSRRKKIIDAFQNSDEPMILISTYQTTGESIDLTKAHYGVLVDSPWIDREQIIRRLFRIGQENDVQFTILNATNSIDEHIEKVNWEAEMIQKIVLDDISTLYTEHDSLLKLYISSGADRKKEQKQLESFRNKIRTLGIFEKRNQQHKASVIETLTQDGLEFQFSNKDLNAKLMLLDGTIIPVTDFSTLFKAMDDLSFESRGLLKDFFEERFVSEYTNQMPVKETILWSICEKLIPGFKDIDYDGRLEFIVELGSYIIGRLIENPQLSRDDLLKDLEDVPEQLYEQTLYYLDTANIFKLFSLMSMIPQTYFYEGKLLRYDPPIRIYYFNGGIQYFDERTVSLIAPDWAVKDAEIPAGKEGFDRVAAMTRELTEAEEKRLANQVRLGNKAAEKVLVGSRLRDIPKIAKRAKYRVESVFSKIRGSIDINDLQDQGQSILFDLVRDYANNEIYYNQSLSDYLQTRLNPRIYSWAFLQAKELMTLSLDNPIYDDDSATVLDMQSVEPDALQNIDESESEAMLKRMLNAQGFNELDQELLTLFVLQGYTEEELAVELADRQDRPQMEEDLGTVKLMIDSFRASMMDLGQDTVLKLFAGEIDAQDTATENDHPEAETWEDVYKNDGDNNSGFDTDDDYSGDGSMRASNSNVGGIDMTPDTLPLRAFGDQTPIELPAIDMNTIDPATFPGFTPVIINITPVYNLYPILGNSLIQDEEQVLSYAK